MNRPRRTSRQKRAADAATSVTPLIQTAASTDQTLASPPATVLLLSDDSALAELVAQAARPPWKAEYRRGASQDRGLLALVNVRVIVLDDTGIAAHRRTRLMADIRRHMGDADLLYVAAHHSAADERRARAGGAQYYTGKPINRPQFVAILKSFMRARA